MSPTLDADDLDVNPSPDTYTLTIGSYHSVEETDDGLKVEFTEGQGERFIQFCWNELLKPTGVDR